MVLPLKRNFSAPSNLHNWNSWANFTNGGEAHVNFVKLLFMRSAIIALYCLSFNCIDSTSNSFSRFCPGVLYGRERWVNCECKENFKTKLVVIRLITFPTWMYLSEAKINSVQQNKTLLDHQWLFDHKVDKWCEGSPRNALYQISRTFE